MALTLTMAAVRGAAARIAEEASSVKIDGGGLRLLAAKLAEMPVPAWSDDLHFADGTVKGVMYTLLLDAVNFCFWPKEFEVDYRGRSYGKEDGYCALAVALKRAFEEDVPLWDPSYLRQLSANDLAHVLRGKGEVPLFDERLRNARVIGEVLETRFGGDALRLLDAGRRHAAGVANLLAQEFAAYRDFRTWNGARVGILKRAQICASDLVGAARGNGPGALEGADELTCFADYKLPQLFRAEGAFAYAPALERRIMSLETIEEDSREEVEIRGCTIHAVELLKAELAKKGRTLTSREIDWMLWDESVLKGPLPVPHHRTITTSY